MGGGALVELGEGRSREGRTQGSPILLAAGTPRLGRALVRCGELHRRSLDMQHRGPW